MNKLKAAGFRAKNAKFAKGFAALCPHLLSFVLCPLLCIGQRCPTQRAGRPRYPPFRRSSFDSEFQLFSVSAFQIFSISDFSGPASPCSL
jgi:hypothetical protein